MVAIASLATPPPIGGGQQGIPNQRGIERWLRVFIEPGQVFEARFLNVVEKPSPRPYPFTYAGYFDYDHIAHAAVEVMKWRERASGCYFTINPVDPELLARCNNHMTKAENGSLTKDSEIVRRSWGFIDADPARFSANGNDLGSVSATQEEKCRAYDRIRDVNGYLADQGFPEGPQGDSGNGYHSWVRLRLALEDDKFWKDFLDALDRRFSDKLVRIDTSVGNLARIGKAYGCKARKASSTDLRPYRYACLLSYPDEIHPVDRGLLEKVIADCPAPKVIPMSPAPARPPSHGARLGGASIESRALAYVLAMPDAIEGQHGHDRIFAAACALRDGFGLSYDLGMPILREYNEVKAKPPESEAQLDHKFDDAIAKCPVPSLKLLNAPMSVRSHSAARQSAPAQDDEDERISPPEGSLPLGNEAGFMDEYGGGLIFKHANDPYRLAKLFIEKHYETGTSRSRTLVSHRGTFLVHNETHYEPREDIDKEFRNTAEDEFKRINAEKIAEMLEKLKDMPEEKIDWTTFPKAKPVTQSIVTNGMGALGAETFFRHETDLPAWATYPDSCPDPIDILPVKNGLLDMKSMKLADHTPRYICPYSLDYEYDDNAAEPARWIKFLNDVFPGDPWSQRELRKWFSLSLSPDNRYQKFLMIVGVPRCGKGTIARVWQEMLGSRNVASPSFGSLGTRFGLWPFYGKLLAIFKDAKITGTPSERAVALERFKNITGDDSLDIEPKGGKHINTKLYTRIVILANDELEFHDPSGAVADRLRPLRMTQSFKGKEDINLTSDLIKELPGILNWALKGREMLIEDKGFLIPKTAKELFATIAASSSPIATFIDDKCRVDPAEKVKVDVLFFQWQCWCESQGRKDVGTKENFGSMLRSVFPTITNVQLRDDKQILKGDTPEVVKARVRYYKGIGLRTVESEAKLAMECAEA